MVEEYEDLSPVGSDSYSLSREKFENKIANRINSTCNLCQKLVEKAGIKWEKVNRILLVGGSCRIPYVRKRLEQQFQRPVVTIDDPELAICYGAAIYGVNLVKAQKAEQKRIEQAEYECQRLERDKFEAELKRSEQSEIERHRQDQDRIDEKKRKKKRASNKGSNRLSKKKKY